MFCFYVEKANFILTVFIELVSKTVVEETQFEVDVFLSHC